MQLPIAKNVSGVTVSIESALANRHGLIAGATGTGKSVSLQSLAQRFSDIGVPVFLADVKGDLSGLAAAGKMGEKLKTRLTELSLPEPNWSACPVLFWDIYGEKGHPVRTTLSEMGPTLIGRLLGLNDTQTSVLQIAFKIADDAQLLLLDLKDFGALLKLMSDNLPKLKGEYGHLSAASIGTIQRALLNLESSGAKHFFGEPALDIHDLLQVDSKGKGYINILAAEKLMQSPMVYSTFLLWLLSELFETLPEVGDLDKPKLVFFFDEAHLLFKDAPKALVEKIEQVVRLIRSKGVGVYFVTQTPADVPDSVLGQLSHRIQHALRAFTPSDQKAVKVSAQTLRPNPSFSAETAITELGVGEALVSVLDAKGTPTVVERVFVLPPSSQIGALSDSERKAVMAASPIVGHYEAAVDRESAFEVLAAQKTAPESSARPAEKPAAPTASGSEAPSAISEILFGSVGPRGGRKAGLVEKAATSAARSLANSFGRELMRGLMGSISGGSSSRRRR